MTEQPASRYSGDTLKWALSAAELALNGLKDRRGLIDTNDHATCDPEIWNLKVAIGSIKHALAAPVSELGAWKRVEKPEGDLAIKPGRPGYCILHGQWWRFDVPPLPHTCRKDMYFDSECAACVEDQAPSEREGQ